MYKGMNGLSHKHSKGIEPDIDSKEDFLTRKNEEVHL